MNAYQINSWLEDKILYAGEFSDFRHCLEQAVKEGINLCGADLSHRNLLNAELDGGDFRQADFTASNLSGANASECDMQSANFSNATLYGAVFCGTDLSLANFKGAFFGATDVFSSTLNRCTFSTISAFSLNFTEAEQLTGSQFHNPCGTVCPMSRPPLFIQGLQQKIIFMDQHMKIGHDVIAVENMTPFDYLGSMNPLALRMRLEQFAAFKGMPERRSLTFHKKTY